MRTSTDVAPRWAAPTVALLTLAWLAATLALLWAAFAIGMEAWSDQHSNNGDRAEELGRRGSWAGLRLIAVALGGPLLIAAVAFAGRLVKTGVAYLFLAILVGALTAPLAMNSARNLAPEPPPPSAPGGCQEHSGGDTRCPGG
ncbi:DUF6234 family protein [Solwaraspora sp. WMMD1047]|uniref:DUF6234 family protein n=1 Tax=Solwaraspora sp. WMMD1047 TaxID=3016102 RepID=UPI00241672C6|nr:DUF6234 family protein [Solwaraspora sp. WMMD1047]MDG4834670.1 DUF6234 family protein [Solwaraspora sp. WMMD1047]